MADTDKEVIVAITKGGFIYHMLDCRMLKRYPNHITQMPLSRVPADRVPCNECHPPKRT
jgi:hypothetical protein